MDNFSVSSARIPRGQVSLDPNAGNNYLGKADYNRWDNHFLCFGGWDETSSVKTRAEGNLPYIDQAFRSFRDAAAQAPPPATDLGIAGNSVGAKAPVVYAEVVRATDLVPDRDVFAPLRERLSRVLVLNYYLFYPALYHATGQEVDGEAVPRKTHEGQWEVVSLYFCWDGRSSLNELTPVFAAYSQSWLMEKADRVVPRPAAVLSWQEITNASGPALALDNHPVVFVARGTHANALHDQHDPTPDSPPDTFTTDIVGGTLMGVGAIVVGVGILLPYPANVVVIIIGAVLIIIGALVMLFGRLCSDSDTSSSQSSHPGESPPQPEVPEPHQGDGAQVGVPPGTPSPGPAGAVTLDWVLRVINMVTDEFIDPKTYPVPDGECERPTWWDYPGLWGVRIAEELAQDPTLNWGIGTWRRRLDNSCFSAGDNTYVGSLGWKNLEALISLLNEGDRYEKQLSQLCVA